LDIQKFSLFKRHKTNLPHFANLLSFLIIKSKKIQKPQILTMTKPRVSTVLHDEDDDASSLEDMFAKLDLYNTSADEASQIADAKEASLQTSAGFDEYMSAAEARDATNIAEAHKAKQGLFSQFRSHISNLKSPFNQKDTPAPVEVSLDGTPRTEMTRHANNLYDNLYHPIDEVMEFNGSPSPNHDPLMPITASLAVTNYNVNFKINGDDDSNTPIRNFNFGEKENPYPRFNAGNDDIATKKSLPPTTYAPAPPAYAQNTSPVTYRIHPVTNQVHPAYAHTTATLPHAPVPPAPAPATLPHAPVPPQVHPAYAHSLPQPPLYQKSSPNVI
jgi:hypothetical protein